MDLNSIIKKHSQDKKYHFFILNCNASFPISFAKHFWLITIYNWKINRFDIFHFKNKTNPDLWYMHKNFIEPASWLKRYIRKTKKYRKSYISFHISWSKWSLAYQIALFLNNNYNNYKFINKYNLFIWPNCNTFVQQILNKFPQIDFKLPRNAFGKNFNSK